MENKKRPTARMLLGKRGEDAACRFIDSLGHRIIARNYRTGHLEIDIISTDGYGVHFVEVKSRVAPMTATPEENVTTLKQKKIVQAALGFLRRSGEYGIHGCPEVFFDVVAVTYDGGEERVEWFPEAFLPIYTKGR